ADCTSASRLTVINFSLGTMNDLIGCMHVLPWLIQSITLNPAECFDLAAWRAGGERLIGSSRLLGSSAVSVVRAGKSTAKSWTNPSFWRWAGRRVRVEEAVPRQ